MKIVGTLMAGVIGIEYYELDESGQVFLVDADKQRHAVSESLAVRVREAIKKGSAVGPSLGGAGLSRLS